MFELCWEICCAARAGSKGCRHDLQHALNSLEHQIREVKVTARLLVAGLQNFKEAHFQEGGEAAGAAGDLQRLHARGGAFAAHVV